MQVAGDGLRAVLEQGFHELDGILEREHGAQVAHVADVWRRVEEVAAREAEGVLELAADAEHLPLERGTEHEGQRSEAAAAAHHVGPVLKPVHDGVVGAQADAAVVREDDVAGGASVSSASSSLWQIGAPEGLPLVMTSMAGTSGVSWSSG